MSKVKILLYCTKGKPYLYKTNFVKIEDFKKGILDKLVYEIDTNERLYLDGCKKEKLNGKIIAECECEKITEFDTDGKNLGYEINLKPILEKSCLSIEEMRKYLGDKKGYALHLSNVKVFDKPKELSDYSIKKKNKKYYEVGGRKITYITNTFTKAPQNMCNAFDWNHCTDYVLISIKPQHLVKILNGEKTIEVRKKILNCLKEKM